MEISDLIRPDGVLPAVKATSKKHVFADIAHKAADLTGLEHRLICERLIAREHLGSTAMGNGVAIPHARIEGLDRIVGIFARLDQPIEFDAADNKGVDLMVTLLAPEGAGADHLRALAKVSRLLRDADLRTKLRQTQSAEALYALMTEPSSARAA